MAEEINDGQIYDKLPINTNRLAGIRCPKCGSYEPFYITCQVVLTVFDDNSTHTSEADWNDESDIICGELTCQHYGVVADFRSEKEGGQ